MKKLYSMMLCLMIGAAALMLGGCAKSINISEYIKITCEGANGYGTISTNLQKKELATEICGENPDDFDLDSIKNIGDMADKYKEYNEKKKKYDTIKDSLGHVDVVVDKRENLKNGDVVKVTVNFPEQLEDALDISVSDTEYDYTVSGLKDVTAIDAFADDVMKVEYTGASPEVSIDVNNIAQESPANSIRYDIEEEGPFKDGDQVTVIASYDQDEMLENGYIVKEEKKTITVASDYKYVETMADLSEDFDKKLQDQALDTIKAYIVDKPVKSMKWNFKGKYIRSFKGSEKNYGENQNVVYYIFDGKVKPKEKGYKAKQVYMVVGYKDVIIGKDGTSTYIPSDQAQREEDGADYIDVGGWYSIYAYTSEQAVFDNYIQKYTDRYNYEVSDGLKNLG